MSVLEGPSQVIRVLSSCKIRVKVPLFDSVSRHFGERSQCVNHRLEGDLVPSHMTRGLAHSSLSLED